MVIKHKQSGARQNREEKSCIRVLVVEDHMLLREGLCAMLESTESIEVADTAATAEEALEKLRDNIDLVTLDISLPGRDGIWLARKIKETNPDLPILVLTMHEQPEVLQKSLEAGVDGYITKWAGQKELLKAIHSVATQGSYLQGRLASVVIDALRCREANRAPSFSEREIYVGKCLMKGCSNSEIAGRLRLSVSTVKSNLRSLYAKLKVSGRGEAVAAVAKNGAFRQADRLAT